jgi:hypothetical protein
MKPYEPTRRDAIAIKLANFVLKFATKGYRLRVAALIDYGARSAARDEREGLPRLPSWSELL